MLRLKLKRSDLVLLTIPRYERFLATSELRILEKIDKPQEETVELLINARLYGVRKWATRLAHDCFESAVITVTDASEEETLSFK